MKKLLLTILALNLTYLLADSITPGNVGLLQPDIRTVDKDRSWADKLNSNFGIIASTMNDILSNKTAVANDTTTLLGLVGSGSGGTGVGNATFTVTIAGGGGVFLATTTPAVGTIYGIGKSTWHVLDVMAYTTFPSTVARTGFKLVKTTSTDYGTPWTPLTWDIHVTTNQKYSVWTTTGFDIQFNNLFGVFITTIPQISSCTAPSDWGMVMRAWKEPEPYP